MYSLSELLQDKAVITVKDYLNTMSLAARILFQFSSNFDVEQWKFWLAVEFRFFSTGSDHQITPCCNNSRRFVSVIRRAPHWITPEDNPSGTDFFLLEV
jgi:hypothetical protein